MNIDENICYKNKIIIELSILCGQFIFNIFNYWFNYWNLLLITDNWYDILYLLNGLAEFLKFLYFFYSNNSGYI